MTERIRVDQVAEQIQAQFIETIRDTVRTLTPAQAIQVADDLFGKLKDTLAGLNVAFPSPPKVDGEAIAEDWRRGLSAADIQSKHGCSRRTAYNHHPNARTRAKHTRQRPSSLR